MVEEEEEEEEEEEKLAEEVEAKEEDDYGIEGKQRWRKTCSLILRISRQCQGCMCPRVVIPFSCLLTV